jgi:hypothetical protein
MCRWLRRAVAFISANASSIIAISSLMIAGFSLYLTIHAQSQDRAYKELMIKPALAIGADNVDFSLTFRNVGVGPAEIKSVVYYFNGHCLSMIQPDGRHVNRENYAEVSQAIKARVFDGVFSRPLFEPLTNTLVKIQALMPETAIGSEKEWVIFKPDEVTLSEIRDKLSRMEPHFAQSLRNTFLREALTLPIGLKYCSMSGGYCDTNLKDETTEVPCTLSR